MSWRYKCKYHVHKSITSSRSVTLSQHENMSKQTGLHSIFFIYLSPISLRPCQCAKFTLACFLGKFSGKHWPTRQPKNKSTKLLTVIQWWNFKPIWSCFAFFFIGGWGGQDFSNNTQENFGNTSETTENNCFTQPYEVSMQKKPKKRWLRMVKMENNFTNGWDMEWR